MSLEVQSQHGQHSETLSLKTKQTLISEFYYLRLSYVYILHFYSQCRCEWWGIRKREWQKTRTCRCLYKPTYKYGYICKYVYVILILLYVCVLSHKNFVINGVDCVAKNQGEILENVNSIQHFLLFVSGTVSFHPQNLWTFLLLNCLFLVI
jgi:hypothetical protein